MYLFLVAVLPSKDEIHLYGVYSEEGRHVYMSHRFCIGKVRFGDYIGSLSIESSFQA